MTLISTLAARSMLAAWSTDGQRMPETVIVPSSDALLDYVAELGERADKIRNPAVGPEEEKARGLPFRPGVTGWGRPYG